MNLMTVFFLQAPAAGPDGSMMWIMLLWKRVLAESWMQLMQLIIRLSQ